MGMSCFKNQKINKFTIPFLLLLLPQIVMKGYDKQLENGVNDFIMKPSR
jgi:hypothetical protein